MNTIFGATFVERWFVEVLSASCSREMFAGKMLAGNILFAALTRHTIVANATIKTVPCHGKSGCLRLRSN